MNNTKNEQNTYPTKNLLIECDKSFDTGSVAEYNVKLSNIFTYSNFSYMLFEAENLDANKGISTMGIYGKWLERKSSYLESVMINNRTNKEGNSNLFIVIAKKDETIHKYVKLSKKLNFPLVVLLVNNKPLNLMSFESADELLETYNNLKENKKIVKKTI